MQRSDQHNTVAQSPLSSCIQILNFRDKCLVAIASVFQLVLAFFDVVGVALLGILVSLSVSEGDSVLPNYVQKFLDLTGLSSQNFQTQIISIGCVAVVTLIGKTVFSLYLIRRVNLFLSRRGAMLSQTLVSKLMSGSILDLQRKSLQESLFALTVGVKKICMGVLARIFAFNADAFTFVFILCGLFLIDIRIAILSISIFGVIGFALYIMMRQRVSKLGTLESKLTIESNQEIFEVLSSFRESFVKNRRYYYATNIGRTRLNLAHVDAQYNFINISGKYVLDSAILVGAVLVATIQFLTVGGTQAISSLGLFLAASSRIAPAVLRLQQNAIEIRNHLGSSTLTLELMRLMKHKDEVPYARDDFDLDYAGFHGTISVRNASFQYPSSNELALENISMELENTKFYAIVGGSGAGKSTLVDLLLGILSPKTGVVSISGRPPSEAIQEWQGAIAYVPQDIIIIDGTIRENVCLGFPKELASDERVLSALKTAQLIDFVNDQRLGLDTYVGDRGTKLSGGQRQRLGIARALFTSPKLIVLDEATSSLDAQVEAEFTASLRKLRGTATVIVIAHRLSTVRDADGIIFLKRGKIEAFGKFDYVRRSVTDFDRQAGLMGL